MGPLFDTSVYFTFQCNNTTWLCIYLRYPHIKLMYFTKVLIIFIGGSNFRAHTWNIPCHY